MKPILAKLPLRLILPVVVLAGWLLISTLSMIYSDREKRLVQFEETAALAVGEAARLVRKAEQDLRDSPAGVEREIMLLGSELEIGLRNAALIGPDGRVIFATRSDWADLPADEAIAGWDKARFQRATNRSTADIVRDETTHLSLLMPYAYPPVPGEITSQRRGAVYLDFDIAARLSAVRAANLRQQLVQAAAAFLLTSILIALLNKYVARPLAALSADAKRIGRGELDIRIATEGPREIATLSEDFRFMAVQLRTDRGALERERAFLKSLFQSVPDLVWLKDPDGVYLACNPRFEKFFGAAEEQILGKTDYDFLDRERADFFRERDRIAIAANQPVMNEEDATFADDGHTERLATIKTPMYDPTGKLIGVLGVGRDITAMRKTEAALQEREERLSLIFRQAMDAIALVDAETGRYVEVNEAAHNSLGFSREEFEALTVWDFANSAPDPEALRRGFEMMHSPEGVTLEVQVRNRAGTVRDVRVSGRSIAIRGRNYISLIWSDVTEQKRAAGEIHRLAYFDSLTALPNRSLLLDRVGQALSAARGDEGQNTLLLLNIDRFKTLNDARGHNFGDILLRAVAGRLSGLMRESDTLARLSADEFAILLTTLDRRGESTGHDALRLAESIQTAIRAPFRIGEEEVAVKISLGITLFPNSLADTSVDILRRADTALHRAKEAGGNQSVFFGEDMEEAVQQRFRIEGELRQAIHSGQLRLFLQPQVNREEHMVGAEALVRWQHPERGLLPPSVFVPVAEESDLIVELGAWVFAEVCRLLVHPDVAQRRLRVAVNISPRHFRQAGFSAWMKKVIADSGADPSHLTLEVTEGLVIDNINDVVATMSELGSLGIHFSIDDFGTGYSSLAYLKRLPIHEIKIDKTFVQDAPTDSDDAALVETILAVAEHLHLSVVAEGVETEEQAAFLDARGKIIHQGYLYGRPEPIEMWLARWRKVPV
ncbi:MAG: EAL domain-containing protein [Rhodocyclaceae bacterium]|nr:EAL domain-containing protein [Rhodocyclaceae bacterium]